MLQAGGTAGKIFRLLHKRICGRWLPEVPGEENEIEGLRSRLNRQRLRLDDADISTIDAFCQKIVREYGDKGPQTEEESRFDARCRVAADTELGILKQDVLEELFLDKYTEAFAAANGDSDFLRFVENYGNDLNDGKIYEIILKIYEYSVSEPNPIAWLESLKDDYENVTPELVNKPQPVGEERHKAAVWMNIRRRQSAAMAKKALDQMDAALREAKKAETELGEIEKFGKHFSTILETVSQNKRLIEKTSMKTDCMGRTGMSWPPDLRKALPANLEPLSLVNPIG